MTTTTKQVLLDVLTTILKLLHPFMPYVTEEIYQMLPLKDAESIMISSYPVFKKEEVFEKESDKIEHVLDDIVAIRNLKATNKITKEANVKVECSEELLPIYCSQLKIKEDKIVSDSIDGKTEVSYQSPFIKLKYFFESEKVDESKLIEEIKTLEASIARREKLLSNENYVNKAPAHVVELDRKKLAEEKEKLTNLKNSE